MLRSLISRLRSGLSYRAAPWLFSVKTFKYFIDSTCREQVTPNPGSVLYCDLWLAVEHSGIYVGDGLISNIVVDGFAESTVMRSNPHSFTSKSTLGRKIYVSCDRYGAVGDPLVASGANSHVGDKAFYGLVIKNCHQFSTKCVEYADERTPDITLLDWVTDTLLPESWEPTLALLKSTASRKLGANKWRLWDWDHDIRNNPPAEPDWHAHEEYFRHLILNAESITLIRNELNATREYEAEISDENIPEPIRQHLSSFGETLDAVVKKYDEVKAFLQRCPEAQFSFADLQECGDDFRELAQQLEKNTVIKQLARKLGRAYISEEKKRQTRIPEISKSEVHGTHRSADLQRLLPSELLNLEDEELEMVFYSRFLEHSLQTYELSGTTFKQGEEVETCKKNTGPIVACLDTSGSMAGNPMLKAKALLLAIANILKQENRSLYVLLFGSRGELREYEMNDASDIAGLMRFLQQGFNGGTDFETPLLRSIELISTQENYLKADVLMISDGDCHLDEVFTVHLGKEKNRLDFTVYSVLCSGSRANDEFSDEVVVL
ncbi:VWA domain-containing protein [Shewanella sp.]|uniref:VWA domain-containing protein n=1 Tax=Shewanella sp. TaxID=50422 RepID=UPI003569790F